jgi:transmembrane protein 222
VIYDFAGPFTIGVDDMAFGRPIRYLQLDPERVTRRPDGASAAAAWDAAVDAGAEVYCRRMHNIVCDNCHSHVARCLDVMGYDGRTGWNMVRGCEPRGRGRGAHSR